MAYRLLGLLPSQLYGVDKFVNGSSSSASRKHQNVFIGSVDTLLDNVPRSIDTGVSREKNNTGVYRYDGCFENVLMI